MRMSFTAKVAGIVGLLVAGGVLAPQRSGADGPPVVIELVPAHGALDVDAKGTKQLVVTFDRPMQAGGWSLCGGGPRFPSTTGGTHWKNPRTLVVPVELRPGHDYELWLNCSTAQNFKSQDGVPLVSTPWSFGTLPEKLPPQGPQRARNKAALEELMTVLAERYSYYDLRVASWPRVRRDHEKALLGAQTDRVWAGAAARMLALAEDLHVSVRHGERSFHTASRAVDSLFRPALVRSLVPMTHTAPSALVGRTNDGIGYLMVASWSSDVDLGAVEAALAELRDAKAMVVDARANAGGNELLAQRVAAWFVNGTRVYAKNRYRTGPGKHGFGSVLERSITGNTDRARRLDVPVAVLTSSYAMSSNESFVLMLQQADDCTVVGQRTFGSSGNPRAHELGNGVTVVLPSWQDLRLDGSCFEGEGLAPDVEVDVDPAQLDTHDPILERALELLRAKRDS